MQRDWTMKMKNRKFSGNLKSEKTYLIMYLIHSHKMINDKLFYYKNFLQTNKNAISDTLDAAFLLAA